jgi:hypothetical protein
LANYVGKPQRDKVIDPPEIYDFQPFITRRRDPLEYLEPDDTRLYTGDIVVVSVTEDILVGFDPELPVLLNERPAWIAQAATENLDVFDDPVTPIGAGALAMVYPYHRRLTSDNENSGGIVGDGIDRLPMCAEFCHFSPSNVRRTIRNGHG